MGNIQDQIRDYELYDNVNTKQTASITKWSLIAVDVSTNVPCLCKLQEIRRPGHQWGLSTNYWGQHTHNIGAAPPPAFMLPFDDYLYILSTDLGSDRFEHLK